MTSAGKQPNFAQMLREETEKQRANKKANYFFENYAQTGAQTIVLRKGAQNALAKKFKFEPLTRVANKNKVLFELYERALSETEGCIRGIDQIR